MTRGVAMPVVSANVTAAAPPPRNSSQSPLTAEAGISPS